MVQHVLPGYLNQLALLLSSRSAVTNSKLCLAFLLELPAPLVSCQPLPTRDGAYVHGNSAGSLAPSVLTTTPWVSARPALLTRHEGDNTLFSPASRLTSLTTFCIAHRKAEQESAPIPPAYEYARLCHDDLPASQPTIVQCLPLDFILKVSRILGG